LDDSPVINDLYITETYHSYSNHTSGVWSKWETFLNAPTTNRMYLASAPSPLYAIIFFVSLSHIRSMLITDSRQHGVDLLTKRWDADQTTLALLKLFIEFPVLYDQSYAPLKYTDVPQHERKYPTFKDEVSMSWFTASLPSFFTRYYLLYMRRHPELMLQILKVPSLVAMT
jgi:hypothetical protein